MAYDFNGNTQHLSSVDPIDAVPLTLACWFRPDVAVQKNLLWLTDNNANNGWGMYLSTSALRGYVVAAGAVSDFATSSTYSTTTWQHACLSCSTNSSRTVYLNASGETTNTATRNVDPATITNLRVGFTGSSFDGLIAEVGIWNAALTQPEIASLAKGMTPDKIRPQNLVFYAPLVRNLQDVKGGLTITNNNAATVANHPRVYA
jgi:hypothetical protein